MKTRYKITLAFMVLTIVLMAALCAFIYFNYASREEKDFTKRLRNRAITLGSFISRLNPSEYYLLSGLDSSTTNLLMSEAINVYDGSNRRIYSFTKDKTDTVGLDTSLVNEIRSNNSLDMDMGRKKLVGIHYKQDTQDYVVAISAINQNGEMHLQEVKQSLFISFVASLLLAFAAALYFSKLLLRPLKNITSAVKNISANNIEQRLPHKGINDEWNDLSVTFNGLLSRLQESFEIQGRFISNASHELSTPLTSISNQIDVAVRKQRTAAEYLAVLQSVRSDIQHMSALTQQLLNIARTSRGGAIQTESVRIDEIIMELPFVLSKISPVYRVHTFFDEYPDDEQQCTVNGNYELLSAAFKNITENACKYSPDHKVDISLSFLSKKIIILFSNTSVFLEPSELENIFQPFHRGSNATATGGYGLGLSLTRRIILLHKGEIKAEFIDDKIMLSVILPSAAF